MEQGEREGESEREDCVEKYCDLLSTIVKDPHILNLRCDLPSMFLPMWWVKER